MTLREESGTGPPPDAQALAGPPDQGLPAGEAADQAPAGPPDRPADPGPPGEPVPAGPPAGQPLPGPPEPAAAPETGQSQPAPTTASADPATAGAATTASAGAPGSPPSPAPRRRAWPAVLIGGAVAICLLGGLALLLLQHGRPQATRNALPAVFQLRTGECINAGRHGISSPTVVPCGQPHDAEIYARFGLAEHSWPGRAAIGMQARQGCAARLGGYLNPQLASTVLAESYVFPDRGAWNAGERTVICEIHSAAGKLTGSVRGLR
jgi:Septum formation